MDPRDNREEVFMDMVKEIHLAIKNTASYPGDHPATRHTISKSYEILTDLLKKQATLTLSVFGDKLLVEDIPINGKTAFSARFAKDLDQRRIHSITFHRGLSQDDFTVFLTAMTKTPKAVRQEGGVASILQQHGVSTIKPSGIKYGKISGESEQRESSHLIDYLSGENDTLGDHGGDFLNILENDPHKISDLMMQATEAEDIAGGAVETMNRIATELLARQGVKRNQFRDYMTSVLSTCNEGILTQLSQTMEIPEGENDGIIDGLVGELFYDAIADICVDEYRRNGEFDVKFVEGLIPSVEEQKRIRPHLERKLRESGTPDVGEIISDFFGGEPEDKEQDTDVPSQDERKSIRDDVTRLLSEGKGHEVQDIIRDLSKNLDDTSWKIRKKVAERLLDITTVLDEFDKVKENFRELSDVLLKSVKQENNIDTYLILSENLHRICTSGNRIDGNIINETLGGRLFEASKLSKPQLQKALMARKRNGKSLQYHLGALNVVDEAMLTQFLAEQYKGCQSILLSGIHDIPENVLKAVPVKFIKHHLILPFNLDSGNLYTATMNPNDLHVLNDIRFMSGYSVVPHLAAEYHLLKGIERFYHVETVTPECSHVMEDIEAEDGFETVEEKQEEITPTEQLKDADAPVVRLVNLIIKEAINQKASDIHIEPYENELRVRFRIDGTLTTLLAPSVRYTNVIASRIKIMSGLDISERRLPQDGRFKIRMNGRHVDFRVSTFPGIFGEKVVLRLLDNSNLMLDINDLGLNGNELNTVLAAMHKSKGMILVTGPTGSGKTTTLYSMLHCLNDGSRNISTAEDPIEYNLRGINQFQMNAKIGLNFVQALRTFLRQDPDIIMVGEIRDLETAEIAVRSALTGHLVLSTLHTNSAPETITRLLDIGIEPYLITSAINLVLAQRLMRRICERCKMEASPNDLQLKVLKGYGFDTTKHQFFKGEGCEECNNTGYKGRTAIYEVMPLPDEIQELILKGESSAAIKERAEDLGLVSLPELGFGKAVEGVTDLDEWMRVVT